MKNVQQECINDILLGIWNNINSFDESKNEFKNWMAGIAKFKVIDYKRKYLKEAGYENIDNLNIHIPDNTLEGIIKKELQEEINEMLSCLKEKDRELFYKLYNKVSFRINLDNKNEVVFKTLNRRNIYGKIDKKAKTLTLTPLQVKYAEKITENSEYKIIGDPFTIDLTQLK